MKVFSCLKLTVFIMLITVKMPTIDGILTLMKMNKFYNLEAYFYWTQTMAEISLYISAHSDQRHFNHFIGLNVFQYTDHANFTVTAAEVNWIKRSHAFFSYGIIYTG